MTTALADLKLEHLSVIYPGDRHYALAERISVVPARQLGGKDAAALIAPPKRRRGPSTAGRNSPRRTRRSKHSAIS
jgi:hypothetical protein